jgi:predicted XRE-type DNA-binding protein
MEGSGNVFADLGLPHAAQQLMKVRLALQIYCIIQARGLTQTEAGKILGIPQPQVSALARNRAGNFSVARLIDFLTALGQDVTITVTPAGKAARAIVCGGCLTQTRNATSLSQFRRCPLSIRLK